MGDKAGERTEGIIVGDRFLDINKPWAVIPHAVSPTTYFASEASLSMYSTILASKKVRPCCIRIAGFIWRSKVQKMSLNVV